MAQTVASHAVAEFTDPQNGQSPTDADQVTANDNALRVGYVAHDADPGIHLQSSALASRPAFGSAGRKWLSADTGSYRLWFDTGSAWAEASYLRTDAGGTVAGNITVSSGGITVTGNSTITGTLGGVTTLTATTVTATNLGGTLSTAAQPNVTSLGTLTGLAVSGSTAISVVTSNAGGITIDASGGSIWLDSSGGATERVITGGGGARPFTVYRNATFVAMSFETQAGEEVYLGADNAATFYINDAANTTTPWLKVSATECTLPAATTARASITLPHGTAPSSPVNGDMWTTTAGLYVRINGVTVGPLS